MSIETEILTKYYKRVDQHHILDIYLPDSGDRTSIIIILNSKPDGLFSTNEIDTSVTQRESDGRWVVGFSVLNNENIWLFELFCDDLIESSKTMVKSVEGGSSFIAERYQTWVTFFARKSKFLSLNVIRGLIGELLFIKHYLIPKYGKTASIDSWLGPTSSKQDFFAKDVWFEVKTIKPGSKTIGISSLEQLSRSDYGELVIIFLNETSKESEFGFTLNSIYNEIISTLEHAKTQNKFKQLMLLSGYLEDTYYDDYVFEYVSFDTYKVIEGFPRVRREDIHPAISEMIYEILISHLNQYKN